MSNFRLKQNGAQVQKAIDLALTVPQLSEAIADETTARENAIADIKAQGIQQTPLWAESMDWLNENGDKSKVYLLPDGYLYAYKKVYSTAEPLFTNQLPLAIDSDGQPYNGGLGYKVGAGIASANGAETENSAVTVTGFIEAKLGDTVRVKGFTPSSNANIVLGYESTFRKLGSANYPAQWTDPVDGVYTFTAPGYSTTIYIRIAVKSIAEDAIVTVNEEIAYSEQGVSYRWANTGYAFVPSDNEERIVKLERDSKDHELRLSDVEEKIASGDFGDKTEAERINGFRYWDRPIYDRIPTYTIADEVKEAVTKDMRTNTYLYQKYDDLMTLANPADGTMQYITKTLLGQDSSGYDVYRYDFRMPDVTTVGTSPISKNKPKVILISGVHPEWAGIYALYNTMYEITTNPDLVELKRNVHFIVVPLVNAYSCITGNRKNINGIDIARNFEIDFVAGSDPTSSTYGGTEPLSEPESQYVDAIMSENQDALFFASCHNFFNDEPYDRCIWGAAATRYFCNLSQKLIDKLTRAWDGKYDFVPENTYLGHTEMSAPDGSEGKQALKYGIQGGTLECRNSFPYQNSSGTYTAFSQSRATEVYINFLLTTLGNHESFDKRNLNDYDGDFGQQ